MKVWRTSGGRDDKERQLGLCAAPSRGAENWRSAGFYEVPLHTTLPLARCAQLHCGVVETFAGSHKDLALWHTLPLNMHVGPVPAESIMAHWIEEKFLPFLTSPALPLLSLPPLLTPALSSLLFFSLAPTTFPHHWVWQGHGFKDVRAPECRSAIGAELPIRNSCAFLGRLCSSLPRPAAMVELLSPLLTKTSALSA